MTQASEGHSPIIIPGMLVQARRDISSLWASLEDTNNKMLRCRLDRGTTCLVVAICKDWCMVLTNKGIVGWKPAEVFRSFR